MPRHLDFPQVLVEQLPKHLERQLQIVLSQSGQPADDLRQRVPCPYDSNHSCFKHQLKKHTACCNSKPGDLPRYIIPGFNNGEPEPEILPRAPLSELSDEYIVSIIEKIHRVHDEEIRRPDLGAPALKHLVQNSSLLALMNDKGLLTEHTCFMELGAGKAKAVEDLKGCTFALVDRATYRHKNENKLKTPDNPVMEPIRIKADIADLCLRQVSSLESSKQVVAMSKHLCGVATDLALRCVVNSLEKYTDSQWEIKGLAMALCCHHRCVWKDFVGKKFFEDVDLTAEDFNTMTVLASWATCGSGKSRDHPQPAYDTSAERQSTEATPDDQSTAEGVADNKHKDRYVRLNLPQEVREVVGRKCKYIIDFARNKYLQSIGFTSEIVFYVNLNTTLENVSIIATR
ncbi:hypothetical protein B566_EDAN010797 [Ephemera danica]|nr:hypothetical protein B566_EDAN010797 [Ephemera danica]